MLFLLNSGIGLHTQTQMEWKKEVGQEIHITVPLFALEGSRDQSKWIKILNCFRKTTEE